MGENGSLDIFFKYIVNNKSSLIERVQLLCQRGGAEPNSSNNKKIQNKTIQNKYS